jgi:hypothetical protein
MSKKKKLSAIKDDLKDAHKFAGAETLKAYKLFHCFIIGKARRNGTRSSKKFSPRTLG